MDILDDELIKFWQVLNEYSVKYIMVGGFVTRFHGFNRSTDDLDLWLEDTLENRKKPRVSFFQLGYGDFPSIETMQFVPGFSNFNIGGGIELDILSEMKGLEEFSFDECLVQASIANLEGIRVPFLHINHLIRNKKTTNGPKDQVYVVELEKIRRIKDKKT
jgi:hypothetical protein